MRKNTQRWVLPTPTLKLLLRTLPSYVRLPLISKILQITSNLANIKNVWGDSSRQYAEADAIAAEYLRTFLGPAKASAEQQVRSTAAGDQVLSAEAKTLNLVFRPKVPR